MTRGRTGEQLTRTADLRIGIFDHLGPLRDPADGPRDRKKHSKHRDWEAHGFEDNTGIKVDIRVKLPLDEIIIVERNFLELHREVEQGLVLDTEFVKNLVAAFAQHMGA